MTRQVMLRAPGSMIERRQSLLDNAYSSRGGFRKVSFGEVAGGTAADCAAVCCCCPCGLVNLVVLAVYKLPAGICRKALSRKRRLRLMKQGLVPHRKCGCVDQEFQLEPAISAVAMLNAIEECNVDDDDKEMMQLEKEMWDKFYGTGFWRSPSQRSEIST